MMNNIDVGSCMNFDKIHRNHFMMYVSNQKQIDRKFSEMVHKAIFFHMSYIPPCEPLAPLLKSLQLTHRRENVFNEEITLVLNISQWKNNFEEEYFTVIMKFLHDMRNRWKYIFVVDECDKKNAEKMFLKIRMYLYGILYFEDEEEKWKDETTLTTYLQHECHFDSTCAKRFEPLVRILPETYRNDMSVRQISQEIREYTNTKTISETHLADYLQNSNGMFKLLGIQEIMQNV